MNRRLIKFIWTRGMREQAQLKLWISTFPLQFCLSQFRLPIVYICPYSNFGAISCPDHYKLLFLWFLLEYSLILCLLIECYSQKVYIASIIGWIYQFIRDLLFSFQINLIKSHSAHHETDVSLYLANRT